MASRCRWLNKLLFMSFSSGGRDDGIRGGDGGCAVVAIADKPNLCERNFLCVVRSFIWRSLVLNDKHTSRAHINMFTIFGRSATFTRLPTVYRCRIYNSIRFLSPSLLPALALSLSARIFFFIVGGKSRPDINSWVVLHFDAARSMAPLFFLLRCCRLSAYLFFSICGRLYIGAAAA